MASIDQEKQRQGDDLYERYGKPAEREHWGKYIAISPGGETLLRESLIGALEEATEKFGPGNFIFKVGEKAVGKWR